MSTTTVEGEDGSEGSGYTSMTVGSETASVSIVMTTVSSGTSISITTGAISGAQLGLAFHSSQPSITEHPLNSQLSLYSNQYPTI